MPQTGLPPIWSNIREPDLSKARPWEGRMIKGVHHFAVSTPDLDRMVDFYRRLFDGVMLREFEWQPGNAAFNARLGLEDSAGRIVMMGFGEGARIEFFQFSVPEILRPDTVIGVASPGYSHVCFETDDCFIEHQRLAEAGMKFHAPPLKMPAGGIFTYGRDVDGNIVEIMQAPPAA